MGGVHPPDSKEYSNSFSIRNAPIPSLAVIPMQQHMGAPAECLVNVGDKVEEGMLIGKSTGYFSANVHSSIPGTVKDIQEIYLPTGMKSKVVLIELEGEFRKPGSKSDDWRSASPKDLLDKIVNMGIVGLGGATFPTHIKYNLKPEVKLEYFVVNGVECEPFLTCDHRLMLEKTNEILEGIEIINKIMNPQDIYIGIEKNKPDALAVFEQTIGAKGLPFKVMPLKVKYPQGDEKQLLKALIGREVPSGGLPLDIGAVVSNVGTVFAIYEAVCLNKPLIERIVTVSGTAVKTPSNLKVRIGTKIGDLIDECNGVSKKPGKIIVGGPMMGFATADLNAPVTKGTSGVLVLSVREANLAGELTCIQCGKCVAACPLGLNPTTLYKLVDHGLYEEAKAESLFDCKECGCCAFVCPSHIPLVQGMRLGKFMVKKQKVK